MDMLTAVVDSYDAARAMGQSRADALLGAVKLYIARHPELSLCEAGNEVVRILRQSAEFGAATGGSYVRGADR